MIIFVFLKDNIGLEIFSLSTKLSIYPISLYLFFTERTYTTEILSLKLRYHIDQVQNLKFQTLNNNGYLKTTSIENTQESEYDINYTTWTSDIALNWRFAPGSQLSLVWKNAIDNEDNILINHWTNNVEESFNLAQQNSVSLKVIYYLDYLYLRK